jgi:predicted metal-dependent hydrolase
MPDWVLDFVLAHELVHLVEPNHGRRFQELLGNYPLAERAEGYLEGWSAAR